MRKYFMKTIMHISTNFYRMLVLRKKTRKNMQQRRPCDDPAKNIGTHTQWYE